MAKIDKNNDFVITNYLTIGSQRALQIGDDTQDAFPVPFAYGALRGNPKTLRVVVEAALAAVSWETRSVANDGTLNVNGTDVVIFAGSGATVNLPALTAGRLLIIKDKSGNASTEAISVNRAGSDTIDGSNTSFSLNANYGALVLVGDSVTSTWHAIAIV